MGRTGVEANMGDRVDELASNVDDALVNVDDLENEPEGIGREADR